MINNCSMDIRESLKAENTNTYNIIYADPPWSYSRGIGNGVLKKKDGTVHYPTMKPKEICGLGEEIQRIAAKDACLLLWATMPNLPQAFDVMQAWGFKYKTCFTTWIKTTKDGSKPAFGVGYYTRSNAELLLLGVRGRIASYKSVIEGESPRKPNSQTSVLHSTEEHIPESWTYIAKALTVNDASPLHVTPRRQHSRKPVEVRDTIVQVFGDLPRLEMFARETSEGWSVLGNQSDKFDAQQKLSNLKKKG